MADWNKVVSSIRDSYPEPRYGCLDALLDAVAKGELVERSESIPTFKERAYKVAHECWDKKKWSINTMELRDVLMAECQAAFAAGAASKQPTPSAPVCQDEREHLAAEIGPPISNGYVIMTPAEFEAHVERERAAVRAECEAQLKIQIRVAHELELELTACEAKLMELTVAGATFERHCRDQSQYILELNAEIERLKARVRELEPDAARWRDMQRGLAEETSK